MSLNKHRGIQGLWMLQEKFKYQVNKCLHNNKIFHFMHKERNISMKIWKDKDYILKKLVCQILQNISLIQLFKTTLTSLIIKNNTSKFSLSLIKRFIIVKGTKTKCKNLYLMKKLCLQTILSNKKFHKNRNIKRFYWN